MKRNLWIRATPLALALDSQTRFEPATQRHETVDYFNRDRFEIIFSAEKAVPGYRFYMALTDKNGNDVYRYIKDGTDYEDGELMDIDKDEAVEEKTLKIGAVLTSRPDFPRGDNNITIIYPLSLCDRIIDNLSGDLTAEYYFTVKSGDHIASEAAIKDLLRENGLNADSLVNLAQQEEASRNIVIIAKVFSCGFIILISLIAVANVFNTVSTNISLRRREFAMLRSVGMARKDFNRMMGYECLLYGSRALLPGIPVSLAVTFLIFLAVTQGYDTSFRIPWAAMGAACASVFLVVFATMMYAMNKIKKDNLIDVLKNENL